MVKCCEWNVNLKDVNSNNYVKRNRRMEDLVQLDMTEEMKDLWDYHIDKNQELEKMEMGIFHNLIPIMRQFLNVYDQRQIVADKMNEFINKVQSAAPEEGDDE